LTELDDDNNKIIIIKADEHTHVTIMLQGINEHRRETNKSSSTLVASPMILNQVQMNDIIYSYTIIL